MASGLTALSTKLCTELSTGSVDCVAGLAESPETIA